MTEPSTILIDHVTTVLKDASNLSNNMLRRHTWWAGYLYDQVPDLYKDALVRTIISEVTKRDTDTEFWCLGCLRDAYDTFSPLLAEEYVNAWIAHSRRVGGFQNRPIVVQFTRFYRLSSDKIKQIIRDYEAEHTALEIPQSPEYNDYLECVKSEAPQPEITSNHIKQRHCRGDEHNSAGSNANISEISTDAGFSKNWHSEKRMSIALIMPEYLSGKSFLQPPLDLLLASTFLKKAGFNVLLDDVRASNHSLRQVAAMCLEADLVMVCTTPYDQVQNYFVDFRLRYAYRTINYLREVLPSHIKIAVCGSHGTVRPDLVLRDTAADYIIRGEYEQILVSLAQAIKNGASVDSIPHVITRDNAHKLSINLQIFPPQIGRTAELDDNLPDYGQIDFSRYYGDSYINNRPVRKPNWGVILANRGCPYTCTFCFNFWGRNYRIRAAESVVDEMTLLQNKYGVQQLFFVDFTFTLNRQWVQEFCALYRKRNLKIKWTCETRCELVSFDLLQDMKNAGCEGIWFGVESFADSVISQQSKYASSEHAVRAIEIANKCHVEPHAFIMIGLPGESVDTLNHTIQMLYKLQVPYTQSVIVSTPRYGTPYYEQARNAFPHLDLDNSFFALNAVRGLVETSLTPELIEYAVSLMGNRKRVFDSTPPMIDGSLKL